jgi:hypothetical protein
MQWITVHNNFEPAFGGALIYFVNKQKLCINQIGVLVQHSVISKIINDALKQSQNIFSALSAVIFLQNLQSDSFLDETCMLW